MCKFIQITLLIEEVFFILYFSIYLFSLAFSKKIINKIYITKRFYLVYKVNIMSPLYYQRYYFKLIIHIIFVLLNYKADF